MPVPLLDLIAASRLAFNTLKAAGDALHADLGVPASLRAVMEALDAGGPAPVPAIARAKNVTRQHIQQIADSGVAAGFLETRDNPAHRRSPLLALTPKGRAAFREIRARERRVLADLAMRMGAEAAGPQAVAAAETLNRLTAELAPAIEAALATKGVTT